MKVDFKKTLDSYKAKHNVFKVIDVTKMQYLTIDGQGTPENKEYNEAIATLYPLAYTLKFVSKELGKDYVVPPLEGLWWADDMKAFTEPGRKEEWHWTMMLMVPDWITKDMFIAVKKKVASKEPPSIHKISLTSFEEGLCVQLLHIGSYSQEGPILQKLHNEFIPENGFKMTGKHHEIYLSDPRRVSPEKLKTILRQPVENLPL
jgi:hypothetical protein